MLIEKVKYIPGRFLSILQVLLTMVPRNNRGWGGGVLLAVVIYQVCTQQWLLSCVPGIYYLLVFIFSPRGILPLESYWMEPVMLPRTASYCGYELM